MKIMNHLDFSTNPVNFNLTLGHWAGGKCLRDQCSEGDKDSLIVEVNPTNNQFFLFIIFNSRSCLNHRN